MRWGRRRRRDDGFTLMEVMVGAALMAVVTAISASGFAQIYQAGETTDAATTAQSDLTDTFNRLDREIRYAYRINPAYQIGTTAYGVDYVLSNGDGTTYTCVQLSLPLGGGTLTRRTWPQTGTSADATAQSTALAADLSGATPGSSPFNVLTRGSDSNYDRLVLDVNATVGNSSSSSVTRTYSVQFTALNTVNTDSSTTSCTKA